MHDIGDVRLSEKWKRRWKEGRKAGREQEEVGKGGRGHYAIGQYSFSFNTVMTVQCKTALETCTTWARRAGQAKRPRALPVSKSDWARRAHAWEM